MTKDEIQAALIKVFVMGQDYWADANSGSSSAWKRANRTKERFELFSEEFSTALQAALNTPQAPDGWQLVPKEPTEEMYDIGEKVLNAAFAKGHEACPEITYKGMLSDARKPPVDTKPPQERKD
jgi:hypothetical protein